MTSNVHEYEYEYIIDNNALSRLKRHRRASDFFRRSCHIPTEVFHEARFLLDIEELRGNEYRTTPSVLTILIEVMATVPISDVKLVNLYANRGNADPLVVACAVDGQRKSNKRLFGPAWVVVSNDKALQAKAAEFGIEVRTNEEFIAILEGDAPKKRSECDS